MTAQQPSIASEAMQASIQITSVDTIINNLRSQLVTLQPKTTFPTQYWQKLSNVQQRFSNLLQQLDPSQSQKTLQTIQTESQLTDKLVIGSIILLFGGVFLLIFLKKKKH